jgi:hypothetical protein
MAHHAMTRLAGEALYNSGESLESRAMEIMVKDFQDLEDQIARREEWMAAQVLQTGAVVCKGEGISETVDFLMPTANKPVLTSTALWSAPTTSTPITNLRAWKKIGTKLGKNMNIAVMNSVTLEYLLANTKEVIGPNSVFDDQKIRLGVIDPTELQPGLVYVGRLKGVGLDIYSYDEWYENTLNNNVLTPMIADGKVILGSTMARSTLHYGAIQDLDAGSLTKAARFPKSWKEDDPSARFVMLQSAPLPALHEIEAFLCATVA